MRYIAYGSNMSIEQMKERCPGSKLIGTGVIKGMRLLFKGHPWRAVATIEKGRYNQSVPVVVWEITEKDERNLDVYEGYPRLYKKVMLPVDAGDGLGEVDAMAYVINPKLDLGAPSDYYYGVLRGAYVHFGFDIEKLKSAVRQSSGDWTAEKLEPTVKGGKRK